MKLTIEICMENAAFEECPELEINRIFNHLSQKWIKEGIDDTIILDANGSNVGQAKFRQD